MIKGAIYNSTMVIRQTAGASTQNKYVVLLLSLLIDLVGMGSLALPFVGELSDLLWGPISGRFVSNLYGNK